jgi:hypothetical protein
MTTTTTPEPRDIGLTIHRAHEAAEKYQKPTITMIGHPVDPDVLVPVVLDKDGYSVLPKAALADYLEMPERRTGTATLTRLDSFIAHIMRFMDADSIVFARDNRENPALTAVLDYHRAGAEADPRFGKHRAVFNFPLSDEWKVWQKFNKVQMDQREFAEFIEDRIVDIEFIEDIDALSEEMRRYIGTTNAGRIATPTRMHELSTNLEVYENSVIKQVQKLQTGEAQIRFESEHVDAAGAPVDIPALFVICIPVFAHDGYYRIVARLRYRATGGLKFWYELWRTDLVFDDAFDKACERVKIETELPLLVGSPE